MRERLADHYAFEPRSAFKRLDRNRNFSLSANEVQDFLRDNGIFVLSDDCKALVAAYDGDKDEKLDYREFEKLVLTNDYSLKMRAYGRPEPFIGFRDKLHLDVEYQLARILKTEIDKLKDLGLECSLLKDRYDFSRYDLFRAIDTYKMNSALREDIRIFLSKNG